MPSLRRVVVFAAVLACAAALAQGQGTLPFQLRAVQGNSVQILTDPYTIVLPADAIGSSSSASLSIIYKGTASSVTITSVDLTGSTDYSMAAVDLSAPLVLNQALPLSVRFTPSTSSRTLGRIGVSYTEAGGRPGSFVVSLVGVAPEFAFSYVPQGGNATLLAAGGTIAFPLTAINATSTAAVVITNRGSGAGVVSAVSGTGAAFQLQGLPLANTSVDAGKTLSFTIAFTPKQLETSSGTVSIDVGSSRVSFNLQGGGSGAAWVYELVSDTGAAAVPPGGSIVVPDVVVGNKSSVVVRVRNTGNADGTISAISVLGDGFQLAGLPFLPLALPVGGSISFTLNFQPSQPGRTSGRLRVGNDTFDVAGAGLGPTLTYAYVIGDVTTAVQNNGSVIFAPIGVGRTATARFVVTNTGTAQGSVNSISISGTTAAFTLDGVPKLPLTLDPQASASFNVAFAPTVTGAATATLKIDTQSFTLSASANPPDPLPGYSFEAPAGSFDAMQQPAIGLTLKSAYPLNLSGTLMLAFNSDVFSNDPAVQFATGGRTVNFTIPANTTKAVFQQGGTQIKVQTGTVAGTITLTPSFATDGGINLTPAAPAALNMLIPQSAPRLLSVVVTSKTSDGFSLLVTGYATGRSLTGMDFQLSGAAGENVKSDKISVNVESTFVAWYGSTTSQPYGSLFTATVPFTLTGDVKSAGTRVDALQSVAVTLNNRQGSSATVSTNLK